MIEKAYMKVSPFILWFYNMIDFQEKVHLSYFSHMMYHSLREVTGMGPMQPQICKFSSGNVLQLSILSCTNMCGLPIRLLDINSFMQLGS